MDVWGESEHMARMRAVVVSGAVVLAAVWTGGCSSSSHAPSPKADPSASSAASPGASAAASGTSGATPAAGDRAKGAANDRPSGSGAAPDRPGDHCSIVCSPAGDRTPGAATGLPEYPGPSASGEPAGR